MNFKIVKRETNDTLHTLDFKDFNFPGGEVGVKLAATNYKYLLAPSAHQTIVAHIQSSNDLMTLAMLKNALEEFDSNSPIHLYMPYTPYARQDRVCDKGESFSIKVLANFINHLNFDHVWIADPHSDVTPALINNVHTIKQFDIITKWLEFNNRVMGGNASIFVSPDAGANKKTSEIAGYFGHNEFIRADKLRDLSTGAIKETIVYADDLRGRDVFICDDICDGGRTFIELAKVLKAKNAGKIVLYVTHGIFSKGIEPLIAGGIDEIWATDSFGTDFISEGGQSCHIFNIESKFGHMIF